jgi:hypothetical protein
MLSLKAAGTSPFPDCDPTQAGDFICAPAHMEALATLAHKLAGQAWLRMRMNKVAQCE